MRMNLGSIMLSESRIQSAASWMIPLIGNQKANLETGSRSLAVRNRGEMENESKCIGYVSWRQWTCSRIDSSNSCKILWTHWKNYGNKHFGWIVWCMNCILIKLLLRKEAPKVLCRVWPWTLTGSANLLADLNIVLDKGMTVFSSEKPAQWFLKRKA